MVDLRSCTKCGAALKLTADSGPIQGTSWFAETYECPNGHTGEYECNPDTGEERGYGACA